MKWPQTTCTVVRVFPEVAYVGGWWVEQQWRHCSLRFRALSLVSMSRCGVYAGWLEPSETWDVELEEIQHQIQGPEGFSLFFNFHLCDEKEVMFMFLFVFNTCTSEISHEDWVKNVCFVSCEMKYHEFTIRDVSFACEKQMAFVSCLAPHGHELLELWCFSWAQTQIHSTSCVKLWLSESSILHFMRGLIFFFFVHFIFQATSERQT